MTPTATRLPGIRFDVAPPAAPEALTRMDVAGFVGFAASGPVGVPVAVEDSAQYEDVFGADVALAWDPVHGEPAYALLGPAVRAFFRNGGRRCWIVRVADRARARRDEVEVPGVAGVSRDGGPGFATLRARAVGSWADGLRVTTALESESLPIAAFGLAPLGFEIAPGAAALQAGDLLRLRFPAADLTLYAAVAASGAPTVTLGRRLWVWPARPAPGETADLRYLGSTGEERTAQATVGAGSPPDEFVRLVFDPPLTQAPPPGALVRARAGGHDLLLDVAHAEASPEGIVAIRCTALGTGPDLPGSAVPAADDVAERLTLSVTVGAAGGQATTLGGLGFAPGHPRFLAELPTDEVLYAAGDADPATAPRPPRFPLAGPEEAPDWYVPVATAITPSPPLGAMHAALPGLERDGLSAFGPGLFLDPALRTERAAALLQTAAFLRDQEPGGRPLEGIHALLDNDEVTLLAVPDAVQRGWTPAAPVPAAPPAPPAGVAEPDWSAFLSCATRVPLTPQFAAEASPPAADPPGAIHLIWSATDAADAAYELQQASDPAFADARDVYRGRERAFDLAPPAPGATFYMRVRALAAGASSAWSAGRAFTRPGAERWLLDDPAPADERLLEVHLAALRMCAARGDVLAVLSLPEHHEPADAVAHVAALRGRGDVPPGAGPDPVFSFGALYHPWLVCSQPDDPTSFRRLPPDGAATGVAAGRAVDRGAWIAPADVPLRDVIELTAPVGASDRPALADAQINVVEEDPAGFAWLAGDTLADDPALRPIGVRRLLSLLRRTAQRYGDAQAFERNDDVARRTVRRTFEALLGRLFSAGAFAGATAAEGFQVATPATGADLDEGRLVVELRVAPSQPLTFLTVRLVRAGSGSIQVLGA